MKKLRKTLLILQIVGIVCLASISPASLGNKQDLPRNLLLLLVNSCASIASVVLCGMIASRAGKSVGGWVALSLLFPIIGPIAVFFMSKDASESSASGLSDIDRLLAKGNAKGLFKIAISEEGKRSDRAQELLTRLGPQAVPAIVAAAKKRALGKPGTVALRVFKAIGEPALEPLIAAFHKGDGRYLAIGGIGVIGGGKAVEPLLSVVQDPEAPEKSWLELQLATSLLPNAMGDRAEGPLLELYGRLVRTGRVQDGFRAMILEPIAKGLGKVGRENSVDCLVALLPYEKSRPAAIAALGSVGSRVGPGAARDRIVSALSGLIAGSASPQTFGQVAMALAEIPGHGASSLLLSSTYWREGPEAVRAAAIKAVFAHPVKEAVSPLLEALEDQSDLVKAEAAKALGVCNDERAFEPLVARLRDGSDSVKEAAAMGLGFLGKPEAVEPLCSLLSSDAISPSVANGAIVAMELLKDRRAVPALVHLLGHKERVTRDLAVSALLHFGDSRAYPALRAALGSGRLFASADDARKALPRLGEAYATEAEFKEHSDARWGFHFAYPSDWEVIYENEPAGSWTIPIAVASADAGKGRACFMVNIQEREILQGGQNMDVFMPGPDGQMIKAPSTPAEYIELNRTTLSGQFQDFRYIEGETSTLAERRAARMLYSYRGRSGRIQEALITLFDQGRTWQFIFEMPDDEAPVLKQLLSRLLASFGLGAGSAKRGS